jgi:chloramphenicol-sensitive protein RarD|tara:strand:- start:837 stop:1718 length:882 start_codon:yes stop_codon:yes gene_type:complete
LKQETIGVLAMLLACFIWGLSALYYKSIAQVPPLEILSHRTIWTALFIGGILIVRKGLITIPQKAFKRVCMASVFISINWFFFIYAVQIGKVTQASLGYYIFPLVAVAFGAIFLGERLSVSQWFAVSLAVAAVILLSVGIGQIPYISIVLALTFGLYGLIKKPLKIGPMRSVFWEVVILLPLALIWLIGTHYFGWTGLTGRDGGFFGDNFKISGALMFTGILTGLPLMLMAFSMERLRLATVGLVQYVNPTLQFLLATLVFMEPVRSSHFMAFALIWVGLGIYSFHAIRQERS